MTTIKGLFVDIDATITDFTKPFPPESLVGQQPVLGVLRDVMVDNGWNEDEAISAIMKYADEVIWWDYPDFVAEFDLPRDEAWERIFAWHDEYLSVYDDTVELVKTLKAEDRVKLFIVSNNPVAACLLKLRRAGLAELDGTPWFHRILGANLLRGQKSQKELWRRAIAQTGMNPENLATLGDHPIEDGANPLTCGIGQAFILCRDPNKTLPDLHENATAITSASEVLSLIS